MIYTLTVCPSVDYINVVNNFEKNKINRSQESIYLPGGKGINVSLVLKQLEVDSIVLGFISGFTGQHLEELLSKENVKYNFINASGYTRINVKIIGDEETAINTNTLIVEEQHTLLLKQQLSCLQEDDILIISGGVAKGCNEYFYEQIINEVNKKVRIIVDAEGKLLLNTLKHKPFLIKPNREELSQLFKKDIISIEDALSCAYELNKKGAKNIIISLDKDGAILLTEDFKTYHIENLEGKVISTVGAGDSLIAGFIGGLEKGLQIKDAFILGVACSNATIYSKSLAKKSCIEKYYNLLKEINV